MRCSFFNSFEALIIGGFLNFSESCITNLTFTSASMRARWSSLMMFSTRVLSRKMALAILSVVFFKIFDSFSSITKSAESWLIKFLWKL